MQSCANCKVAESGYRADVHETPVGLRERKKQRTREQITGAALELFSTRGYHATTVAEIAAAADVSERTVFGYFATKEDILFADHHALEQGLSEALERRPHGHALDALREFLVDNLSRFDEQA